MPQPLTRRLFFAARTSLILAMGSALIETGCTVGPDYTASDPTLQPNYRGLAKNGGVDPTSQPSQASAMTRPSGRWWTQFNDPVLTALIEKSAGGNLSLQRAASRIRQGRAELTVAGGRLLPQLDATGGYARAHGSKNVEIPSGAFGAGGAGPSGSRSGAKRVVSSGSDGQSGSGGSSGSGASAGSSGAQGRLGGPQSPLGEGGLPGVNTDLFQVGLDASWEIDVFGGNRRLVEAASAELQSTVEDARDVLVSLLAEVARDYLQLRGLQRRLLIARQNLAIQEDTLSLVRSRQKAGFVTDLDVARAESQVAATRASLPLLQSQIRQTIHAISVLAGAEPEALAEQLVDPNEKAPGSLTIPVPPASVPVGIPADLLRRRPDLRRAERQIAAAVARTGAATSDLYPKFSISGSFGFDATKAKHLFDRESYYFLLSPGVRWPIFEGGRIRANIDANTALQEQAILSYREAILTALREVEDALVAYAAEQERARTLAQAVRIDRDAVELARQQYQRGVIDFQVVLDTQRDLLQAEDLVTQSDQTIATNLVALYKALGGGWEMTGDKLMTGDKSMTGVPSAP